jgi:taurine dioxygenase
VTSDPRSQGSELDVRPLTPVVGAEVLGVDLAAECSDALKEPLRRLLLRHGVLVFRDQYSLTRESQIRFASHFGSLERYPAGEPTHPEIVCVDHGVHAPPTENVWHSDMSFRGTPPMGSLLRAIVLPPVGGDTVFADMRQAWSRLSEAIRSLVHDLRAEHDIAKWADDPTTKELRESAPPVEHPLVRVHPETEEELLYVNASYTTRVIGLSTGDSTALLDHLFRQVVIPELQCRISWKPGTVVFWDNRSMQHYALGDYLPSRRVMERVTIAGDSPVGPGGLEA